MSSRVGSPSHTDAFKEQVRRHCEQKLAENFQTTAAHSSRLHSVPGPRFHLHEQRRSSDGQLPPMFTNKGASARPPPSPKMVAPQSPRVKTKSGNLLSGEIRRSSDGQLQPIFLGKDGPTFTGPPPNMIPHHLQSRPKFNTELRRSSDGQLQPIFQSKDSFVGPPPLMIPKHIQQESGITEVQVSPTQFKVDLDVTGYAPEELAVKIVGDHIVIRGKHAEESPGEETKITREFSRRYTLPEDVLVEDVSVFLAKSGKLSVKVPRIVEIKAKRPVQRKVKFQE
ncbi:uncharacterized protein LOC110981314 [Acanthaster planci]|uniref:Uncharacterized protein LOC110981314 n=1 Tax=Acanthaster planci TaxID=133434 RepID=A0A8B7YP96_ACAPL|nr:uncharacterized protein LOC110981314 [Acanthaster planci]